MVTFRSIITLLVLLISNNSYALSIAIEKSTQAGLFQKAVKFDANNAIMTKNTNYFDESQEVGMYTITNPEKLSKIISELKRLEKGLDLIATKTQNPSSVHKPHHETTYLKINNHFISQKHPLFKKVDEKIAELFSELKIKKVDVLSIEKDKGFLVKVINKDGKQSKQDFDRNAGCRQDAQMLICNDDKYGTVFIK